MLCFNARDIQKQSLTGVETQMLKDVFLKIWQYSQ